MLTFLLDQEATRPWLLNYHAFYLTDYIAWWAIKALYGIITHYSLVDHRIDHRGPYFNID